MRFCREQDIFCQGRGSAANSVVCFALFITNVDPLSDIGAGLIHFAVGRNEEATRFSGVNARRVVGFAYILAAFLTGISAILFAFYTNSVSPSSQGNFYELYGIAAAVLGGCSLRGGEGSILGIIIGTTLLLVLENLVNLLGIDSSLNFAVMGAVVLFGVLADQLFKDRSAKKTARQAR